MCHLSALDHGGLTQGSWPIDPACTATRFSKSLFVGSQSSHLAHKWTWLKAAGARGS